jgi:hypothetical protein
LELSQLPQARRQERRARTPRLARGVARGAGELVAEAIAWLDERWRGGVFVPDELLPLVEAA